MTVAVLTVGSLFSGIGGIDLGLERAGMQVLWQVECDPYARKVLAKNWPQVVCHDDVRRVGRAELAPVDVLAGGFPCQDISGAGGRAGIDGERSGLWREFARLIRELRPRYVLVENVAALLVRGMGRVLGDLAELGFDAEWSVLSACSVGAPHLRERVLLVAYPHGQLQAEWVAGSSQHHRPGSVPACGNRESRRKWMATEPAPGGVDDGFPDWMDRLGVLGNAVVPQVAELVGRLIVEHSLLSLSRGPHG